jgi:hypothetical protein
LPRALDLIQAWGFEYKTVAFYWVKLNSAAKHEADYFTGLGYHSRKPDCVRDRIERVVLGPHLDAFQSGEVKLETSTGDIEVVVLAKSVLDMWTKLFTDEGW